MSVPQALREENLRKAGVIEALRRGDSEAAGEVAELKARTEAAETKTKGLTKELARKDKVISEIRQHHAAAKTTAVRPWLNAFAPRSSLRLNFVCGQDEKGGQLDALEQRVKDLVASNGRKDVTARTLKGRIEELSAEIATLKAGHSEEADAAVAAIEAAAKENARQARNDLARKEERVQLLLAKVSEMKTAKAAKAVGSRELRWLRGAVKRALAQLTAENGKLSSYMLPVSPALSQVLHPTGKLRLRVPMGANAQAAAGSGAPSSVEEFSTSVLSDLCAEDSDGDSVVGYRSEGETAVILSPGAIEANPHHQMRRSANEPLVGLPIPEPEPESDKDLVDTGVLAATEANVLDERAETGGRGKGKAPRASEVRKWLAGLIEGVSGMDRLATAALGATGHGGVSCPCSPVLQLLD